MNHESFFQFDKFEIVSFYKIQQVLVPAECFWEANIL